MQESKKKILYQGGGGEGFLHIPPLGVPETPEQRHRGSSPLPSGPWWRWWRWSSRGRPSANLCGGEKWHTAFGSFPIQCHCVMPPCHHGYLPAFHHVIMSLSHPVSLSRSHHVRVTVYTCKFVTMVHCYHVIKVSECQVNISSYRVFFFNWSPPKFYILWHFQSR